MMTTMFLIPHIKLPSTLYLRNPEETALGRGIVGTSVELMYEIGFEAFTFKKLAAEMKSTEASVYRYFSNKHQLLQYLIAWYWLWVLDLLKRRTLNVSDPAKCLRAAISVLVDSGKRDDTIPHIDEAKLQKITVIEGSKAGRSEGRAKVSEDPSFDCYRLVCDELCTHIKSYKPRYKTPRTLATTLVFTAHQLQHLARLKNNPIDIRMDDRDEKELSLYLETILFAVLG
jgi:AcrR family transcriptional regulator